MSHKKISELIDIYEYPQLDMAAAGTQITIGDLHGNAIKLLCLLRKHGIATNLSEEDYKVLVSIYEKDVNELTKTDLSIFNGILNKLDFNKDITVRLIGDELADRGSNDYFTLKILEKLHQNKVPLEILFSNHSLSFIHNTEVNRNSEDPFPEVFIYREQTQSMLNMATLIKKGLIKKEEIYTISETCYKPHLKAISYTIDKTRTPPTISIYSHAPIDLKLVAAMAAKLSIPYDDETIEGLASTIDNINDKFQDIVKAGTLHTYYSQEYFRYPAVEHSFEYVTWNRDHSYAQLDNRLKAFDRTTPHKNGYGIYFVHGHDPYRTSEENVSNLDHNNELGKPGKNKGIYNVLYSENESSLQDLIERGEYSGSDRSLLRKKEIQSSEPVFISSGHVANCSEQEPVFISSRDNASIQTESQEFLLKYMADTRISAVERVNYAIHHIDEQLINQLKNSQSNVLWELAQDPAAAKKILHQPALSDIFTDKQKSEIILLHWDSNNFLIPKESLIKSAKSDPEAAILFLSTCIGGSFKCEELAEIINQHASNRKFRTAMRNNTLYVSARVNSVFSEENRRNSKIINQIFNDNNVIQADFAEHLPTRASSSGFFATQVRPESHSSFKQIIIGGNVIVKKDPYRVLGIEQNTSKDDIGITYNKLFIKYKREGNEEGLVDIIAAYKILNDDTLRYDYDRKAPITSKSAFN